MKQKIKWIFFDVGCTLVDEEKCFRDRCHKQSLTKEAQDKKLDEFTLYNEIILASKIYEQQYKYVVQKFDLKTIFPHDTDLEELYFDTIPFLDIISKKYKLGIIANQSKGLSSRLENFGILKYFDVVVGSNDVGYHKPDLKIFELALDEAKASPEESIMVGDRLDNDIYPAKKLGMKTIWILRGFGKYQYPKNSEYEPDLCSENLLELVDRINEIN